MSTVSNGTKQSTKRLPFTLLSAFFNFVKNSLDPDFVNPCVNPAMRKLFRASKPTQLKILEKDVVDEIIFRTHNPRNRLMLELMARSGMRIGEVLKLTPMDIDERKAIIRDPKSGREAEAGNLVGVHVRPHDLRRHAATFASRSETPLEIVSKVLLRHSNLSTTQRYLGKISDVEAMRWIDNLHG